MISAVVVLKIVVTYAGCWAVGYSSGFTRAWIKKIGNVA